MKKIRTLTKRCKIILEATSPFNFKYTVYKPSHFPTRLEEFNENSGVFYRTFRLSQEKLIGLKMTDLQKARGRDGILMEVYSNRSLTEKELGRLKEHVSYSYSLTENINDDFYDQVKGDKSLQGPIRTLLGMRNSCFETLYEILNISSILQNTTVRRSEQMMNAMLSNFGERVTYDGRCFYIFYTPEDILRSSEQRLRELKLGYRAKFLIEIAKHFSPNSYFEERLREMSFEEAKTKLMKIKGVGPYSANLALFAYLKHSNFINFDVWNRKIFSDFLFGIESRPLEEISYECEKRWGNYKGYAALYIIENLFVKRPELQYWKKKDGN